MTQRISGPADIELASLPWNALTHVGMALDRQDVSLLVENGLDLAVSSSDSNNKARRRLTDNNNLSCPWHPASVCLLVSNALLVVLLLGQTVRFRGGNEHAGRHLQHRGGGTVGSNVWQLFRLTDKCPWTEQPDDDPDCIYKRRISKHVMDSILRCGLESEPRTDVFARNDHSISHRGMPLVAPEHSLAGYELARRAGAGFIECDASVTKDLSLVCRHSTCDLHTTTDILKNHNHLASHCSVPFRPATETTPAVARCCTYDFTAAELKQLCLQMDADVNVSAVSPKEYTMGPPAWRSTALQEPCQQVVTYSEYLGWVSSHGLNAIPELKDTGTTGVQDFLNSSGISVEDLAKAFMDSLLEAGFTQHVKPGRHGHLRWQNPVGPKAIMQTFDRDVALYWKSVTPSLPVLYLYEHTSKSECTPSDCGMEPILLQLSNAGVEIMAPPLYRVVNSVGHRMGPTDHARFLNTLPVGIVSWSLDRSGCPSAEPGGPAFAGPCGAYWTGMQQVSAFEWSDIVLLMYEMYYSANATAAFSDYPSINTLFLNCVSKVQD